MVRQHYTLDIEMKYKVKPFYLTLTPTKRATTQVEQARFMSDFHTQLQSTIK